VLLDSTQTPVYFGGDALEILLHPAKALSFDAAARAERLAALKPADESRAYWCVEFLSGRRHYRCRGMRLEIVHRAPNAPVFAMLLERRVDEAVEATRLPAFYRLSPREREAVHALLDGLDGEQMAARLGISPHGVKALLARVMRKMGVTTRSGILGKYVASVRRPEGGRGR